MQLAGSQWYWLVKSTRRIGQTFAATLGQAIIRCPPWRRGYPKKRMFEINAFCFNSFSPGRRWPNLQRALGQTSCLLPVSIPRCPPPPSHTHTHLGGIFEVTRSICHCVALQQRDKTTCEHQYLLTSHFSHVTSHPTECKWLQSWFPVPTCLGLILKTMECSYQWLLWVAFL